MTNKIKTRYRILGLMTGLIVMLIAVVDFSNVETEVSQEINDTPRVNQLTHKAHWIIQTTSNLLKINL